jgi:hypothetical protein
MIEKAVPQQRAANMKTVQCNYVEKQWKGERPVLRGKRADSFQK